MGITIQVLELIESFFLPIMNLNIKWPVLGSVLGTGHTVVNMRQVYTLMELILLSEDKKFIIHIIGILKK